MKRAFKRHLTYRKAHTISNKLVSKVSAQKKGGGGEVMTATNTCSNFGGLICSPTLTARGSSFP